MIITWHIVRSYYHFKHGGVFGDTLYVPTCSTMWRPHWSALQCTGSQRLPTLCLKVTGIRRNQKWSWLKHTKWVATKRVERDLEGGAEMGDREVGDRGQSIVSHDGKHESAANHVAWNKHITLSHYHQFSDIWNYKYCLFFCRKENVTSFTRISVKLF